MREATEGERALGCPDRGLLGGFSAALLRHVRGDPDLSGRRRSWAMAALTSYGLKTPTDRAQVCAKLAPMLPSAPVPGRGAISPDDPIDVLPGVGGKVIERLRSLELRTVSDLLDHFPRAYLDRRDVRRISDVRVGHEVTVVGKVREAKVERMRTGRRLFRCAVYDGSGYVYCVWWGQEWRSRVLTPGTEAAFSGKVESRMGRLQMTNPSYDLIGLLGGSGGEPPIHGRGRGQTDSGGPPEMTGEGVHTGRVVPVYPASEQMSATWLRRILHTAFERVGRLPDPLPARLRVERNLVGRDMAYRLMHFPDAPEQVPVARRRLVFEELFTLQVGLALRKLHIERDVRGVVHEPKGELVARFLESLPFRPTAAQERSIREIADDMARPVPMHRLLQGEVGSGKTLVAVHAALVAVQSGNQAAIMAPTEVLAEQHARRVRALLEPVGVEVALLTSAVPAAQRRDTTMRLAAGDIGIACGTHALLSEDVAFKRLSLAVVDEQHRFGLGQRISLKAKGADPDVLIMTATPIPRTLALTLYGDLDVSVLDELPAGRRPIETRVVGPQARSRAYEIVREEARQGRRAYVICALVDESDVSEAKAAVAEAERLRTEVFPDLSVGLLHGQMAPREKDRVMEAFRTGEVSVLIATTVVEVGVDVPEATVMLIENAERFGLSQLHQLRGRIGRGEHGGRCILFADATTDDARRRLEAIATTNDGFALAEEDLRIRGEGTIFGMRQAGLADLKLARLVEDFPIVVEAREAAFKLVDADPRLGSPEHALLREDVSRRLGDAVEWLFHG